MRLLHKYEVVKENWGSKDIVRLCHYYYSTLIKEYLLSTDLLWF